jgi:hypothetical protein
LIVWVILIITVSANAIDKQLVMSEGQQRIFPWQKFYYYSYDNSNGSGYGCTEKPKVTEWVMRKCYEYGDGTYFTYSCNSDGDLLFNRYGTIDCMYHAATSKIKALASQKGKCYKVSFLESVVFKWSCW